MMKKIYQKVYLLGLMLGFFWTQPALAQVTYLGSQFYENQYVGNPAMSGVEEGVILSLGYRSQWRTMPGSPVTQSFTAEYGKDKVGAGINIYNDKAGLLGQLRAVGTYSYHMPLDDDERRIHFGVSLGVSNTTFDHSKKVGDDNDYIIEDYNKKPYMVGDFGVAYTTDVLTLQAALPNMKKYFEKDDRNMIDRATFLMAISYKIQFQFDGVQLEPKLIYRGAKGIDNIFDIGSNVRFKNSSFTAMGMYHSNKSFTFGFGLGFHDRYAINGYYTNQWTDLSTSFGGNFEIALRANVFNSFN